MLFMSSGLMLRSGNSKILMFSIRRQVCVNGGGTALKYCPYDKDLLDWEEIPKNLEELCPLDVLSRTSLQRF